MNEQLNELMIILTTMSLTSWSMVVVTAIFRTTAQLWYQRQGQARLRQQVEEAVE